jgi:hypothetical protein
MFTQFKPLPLKGLRSGTKVLYGDLLQIGIVASVHSVSDIEIICDIITPGCISAMTVSLHRDRSWVVL